jgi:transcriptional regulator with XRE-family HTH domain
MKISSGKVIKIIGTKIRIVRKAKKISQEKLAELSGLHPTYISNIECGKVNPSVYTIYLIAYALKIPCEELFKFPVSHSHIESKIESKIAEVMDSLRCLDRKKQIIFLLSAKGLISGLREAQNQQE